MIKFGLQIKAPLWNLIIHDLSKLSFKELPHYGRHFFGDKSKPREFDRAWLHHQNVNPHHWEYWVSRTPHGRGDGKAIPNTALPMPEKYIREMLADWLAAGKTYSNENIQDINNWPWWNKAKDKMVLHPDTRKKLDYVMDEYFTNLRYKNARRNN